MEIREFDVITALRDEERSQGLDALEERVRDVADRHGDLP